MLQVSCEGSLVSDNRDSVRLPTEAEWEYACRAGTTTRFYSGDDPETMAKIGNVADAALKAKFPDWTGGIKASDGFVFTAPVGKFTPNAFGLYDMLGNAQQWCADRYSEEYYATSPVDDPPGPDSRADRVLPATPVDLIGPHHPAGTVVEADHVLRGGSWRDWAVGTRSARRLGRPRWYRDYETGFRVARTP